MLLVITAVGAANRGIRMTAAELAAQGRRFSRLAEEDICVRRRVPNDVEETRYIEQRGDGGTPYETDSVR